MNFLKTMIDDEDGVATVEYAMLLALLVVAALATWTVFGTILKAKVRTAGNSINGIS